MKKVAILLNMGGPSDISEVHIFLKNMFEDPCILGIKNKFIRKIVAFCICRARHKIAVKNYQALGGKSPIVNITQKLGEKIKKLNNDKFDIDYAMNYTAPFAKEVLAKYKNYDEIVLFPLYPHHSITTITSSINDVKQAMQELKMEQKISVIKPFYESEQYNNVILNLVKNEISNLSSQEIKSTTLIFSAHSLPQKIIAKGDLYEEHVLKHIEILKHMLKKESINFQDTVLAYQSKLGPVKWLEPNLSEVLLQIKNRRALIFPISFCIDNSETDFELSIEYKHIANQNDFEFYKVAKCPNNRDDFANFIIEEVEKANL